MDMALVMSGFHDWLDRWAPAAEWAVAIGTATLAIATWRLAKRAKAEAVAVAASVKVQTEQLAASERPCVYPITPHKWLAHLGEGGRWLAFRNGGSGIAQNVRGQLWWHDEDGNAALIGQTLGPGDHFRVWLLDRKGVSRWYGAEGYVIYEDVRGVEWQSRFRYEHDGHQVWARLFEWRPSSELGDPETEFPREGWADEDLPDLPESVRYRT
jgi:hypothetical protein